MPSRSVRCAIGVAELLLVVVGMNHLA